MRVLQLNKFFYVKGGSERYFFDVMHGLAAAGHTVIPFSMQDDRNEASPFESDFVSHVDFQAGGSPVALLKRAARFVHSGEACRKLRDLVRRERPDVAHLHNVAHQLTPSIVDVLASEGVPVVQTLHDYKPICSSYLLYANGAPCERCRGGKHYQAVLQRCHHGSRVKSVLGFVEMGWHVLKGSYDPIARFLCPSEFLRGRCEDHGLGAERLLHVPYFLNADAYEADSTPGAYALYMGRLSREKGVETLIRAAADVGEPLVIVGDGPLRPYLEAFARSLEAPVCFDGYRSGEALQDRVRGAAFVAVPSEWYENLPYAVLESFALGKPVLGARIGESPSSSCQARRGVCSSPATRRISRTRGGRFSRTRRR